MFALPEIEENIVPIALKKALYTLKQREGPNCVEGLKVEKTKDSTAILLCLDGAND